MTTTPTSRVPELDGLRGLAILLVIIHHYVTTTTTFRPLARILGLTFSGVDCFFVLSGFLIGGILLDHRKSAHYFRAFYARRTLRILPIYYASLALCFLLPAVLHSPTLASLFHPKLPISNYLTLTQNFAMVSRSTFGASWLSVTWSLSVEEQFYLVLPLVIWLIPRRALPLVLLPIIVMAPFWRLNAGPTFSRYVVMPYLADSLLLGVLVAWLVRSPRCKSAIARLRPLIQLVAVAATGVLVMVCVRIDPGNVFIPWLHSLLAIFYTMLLILAVSGRGLVAWCLRCGWLRRLGVLAYGLYLLHVPAMYLSHYFILGHGPSLNTPEAAVVMAAAAAATYLAAAMSWRFLERPLMAIGQRVSYDRSASPLGVTGSLIGDQTGEPVTGGQTGSHQGRPQTGSQRTTHACQV